MSRSQGPDWLEFELLEQFRADEESGGLRPLHSYVARYPEHTGDVARIYAAHASSLFEGTSGIHWGAALKDNFPPGFLHQLRCDREAGRERPLAEYLQQFPGHDKTIARACFREHSPSISSSELSFIGPYAISKELGRGGQGIVFLARHEDLGHEVALKVLQGLGPGSSSIVERFYREAKVAARLDHPSICKVLDAGLDNGTPFIAMQFIDGTPLHQRIKNAADALERNRHAEDAFAQTRSTSATRAEIDYLLLLFEKTARALHAAHEAGVVHRDIKPANIMVRPDGDPVILDFGLSRSDDDDLRTLTQTGDVFGTPAYMSPEQFSTEQKHLDRRTDTWSLGVTLFECLSLVRPFAGQTRQSLYLSITQEEPPSLRRLNPKVGRDLSTVVAKTLEKDPARRFETTEELADELQRIREHRPILARPVGPLTRTARWAQRHPAIAFALGFVLLVLSVTTTLTASAARDARAALAAEEKERRSKDVALAAERKARRAESEALTKKSEALRQEENARAAARIALQERTAALAEYTRLADAKRLANAKASWEELWPITPALAPKLLAWQEEFGSLLSPETLTGHETALKKLRKKAEPDAPASGKLAERFKEWSEGLGSPRTWRFASSDDAFRHEILSKLVTDLREFTGSKYAGAEQSIADRLMRCNRIESLTVTGNGVAQSWRDTIDRIRSNPLYHLSPREREMLGPSGAPKSLFEDSGAMTLPPQIGLIPLGADPRSGLEEFLHLESHTHDWSEDTVPLPQRRAITEKDNRGGFVMKRSTGVIFVLIPAGTFSMGSQNEDPARPNFDPGHTISEAPIHAVSLAAYFLSKYEVTQLQWARGALRTTSIEARPSQFGLGAFRDQPKILPSGVNGTHPVEEVDWFMCSRLTAILGLSLPTEAQWERAARANDPQFAWSGAGSMKELSRVANISGKETFSPDLKWPICPEHRDAFVAHAPVGSFRANGFGLHDMTGNVSEWCREPKTLYSVPPRSGDGLREAPWRPFSRVDMRVALRSRVSRGGSYGDDASLSRVAFRANLAPQGRFANVGLRPARGITTH